MQTGVVFDIKEFSIYDGPGVRITVFLKGCPLRCLWCHNPEGLSKNPQIMLASGCANCGKCKVEGCNLSGGIANLKAENGACIGCGRCVDKCPEAFRKLAGQVMTTEELKERIMKNALFLQDGGVTFSGGEPTMQADFLLEMLDILPLHKAIQTSGFCPTETFAKVLEKVDFLFFDIKHANCEMHKKLTDVSNELILKNLELVKQSEKPFIARIPLIAGLNDDLVNMTNTAELLKGAKNLVRVELLPFNGATGAKYRMVGKEFDFDFHAPTTFYTEAFEKCGIKWKIL